MKMLVQSFSNLFMLAGADPFMLPLLSEGGAGCITATSNLVGVQLHTVFDNYDKPERAAEVDSAQARIVALRNLSNSYVQIPTIKTMVAHRKGDDGWCRVRPPGLSSKRHADPRWAEPVDWPYRNDLGGVQAER